MANNRIFYAVQKAGISPDGSKAYDTIHGLQSFGTNTTFNLEQVFELGQLAIYENIEGLPSIEITAEKVLDGWPPIYTLATQTGDTASLTGRSQPKCCVALAIYSETNNQAYGGGHAEVQFSGMYIGSVGYSVRVDGNATESVTFVGNNKVWVGTAGYTEGTFDDGTHWDGSSDLQTNSDQPYSINGSGGVNRREDVLFGTGTNASILPLDIPGVTNIGGYGRNVLDGDNDYGVHVQSIDIKANLGRDEILELGRKGPYYRFVRFPVEVTTEISVISSSGDGVSASQDGLYSEGGCGTYNLLDRSIKLCLCEGLVVDCGSRNKLSTVGVTGGDTGGANVEVTYTYTNFNDFTVTHPNDPAHLTA